MNQKEYVDQLRATFVDFGVKFVVEAMVKKSSFFASGFGNWLLVTIAKPIIETLVFETQVAIFFWYIDLRVSKQGAAFTLAMAKNKEVQANGTDEEKIQASKDLELALIELVNFNRV